MLGVIIVSIAVGGCTTKEKLDRAAAETQAENHRKGQEAEDELKKKEEARVAALAEKQKAEEAAPKRFFVATPDVYLFDSLEACKTAANLAVRAPGQFAAFAAQHGTSIAKGTQVQKVGSEGGWPAYYDVVDPLSGTRGWITSEFIEQR